MSGEAKSSRFGNMRKNFVKFWNDVRIELKKVIWPTKQQLINNTATVLAACIVVGAIIWLADAGLGKVARTVFTR